MSLAVDKKSRLYAHEEFDEPPRKKSRVESNVLTATKQLPSNIALITAGLEKLISNREYRFHPEKNVVRAKLEKMFNRCVVSKTDSCKYPDFAEKFRSLVKDVSLTAPPALTSERSRELPQVAVASTIGGRKAMEDTSLVTPVLFKMRGNVKQATLSAVFDGHGGDVVAVHAQNNYATHLQARLEEYGKKMLTDVAIWNALKISCVDTSRSIYSEQGGTTATICLRIGNVLWVANAGDSRTILVTKEGKAVALSEDFSLELDHYKRRIENRGATVDEELHVVTVIEGGITVDNAGGIGENCFGNPARPKIVKYMLPHDPSGYFLVQASDGLWDTTTSDDVAAFVHENRQNDPKTIAEELVTRGYNASDHDNSTVIISKF